MPIGPRVTLHTDPDFEVWVNTKQPSPGVVMTFLHNDVFRWSIGTLRRLNAVWPGIREQLPPIIFCHGHVDDEKFHKFVTHFGFQHIHHTPCSDGQTRRIYAHYLKRVSDGRRA
jgi:hypothetical protein